MLTAVCVFFYGNCLYLLPHKLFDTLYFLSCSDSPAEIKINKSFISLILIASVNAQRKHFHCIFRRQCIVQIGHQIGNISTVIIHSPLVLNPQRLIGFNIRYISRTSDRLSAYTAQRPACRFGQGQVRPYNYPAQRMKHYCCKYISGRPPPPAAATVRP